MEEGEERQRLLHRQRNRRYRASLPDQTRIAQRETRRNQARDLREARRTQFVNWGRQTSHDEFLESNFNGEFPVDIGSIDVPCSYCGALRFADEHAPSCCAHGQVIIPAQERYPAELWRFWETDNPLHGHFKKYARRFNNAFGMASLELPQGIAASPDDNAFMPIFTIQGKLHHNITGPVPHNDLPPAFLQLFFVDFSEQVQARVDSHPSNNILDTRILSEYQQYLHNHNVYVRDFKTAFERLRDEGNPPDRRVKIGAIPSAGEHHGVYNSSTASEISVITMGDPERSYQ